MLSRRSIVACVAAVAALLVAAGSASAVTYPPDYSAPNQAWNVLPPGEAGTNPPGANSFSQVPLYDGLTPNFDTVTDASLPVFFKKNVFGLGGESPASTFSPPGHPGVVIERDSKGVAHITGATRADSMFGIGFVSYQDRVLLMEQLRGPSRLAAIDAPGINPFQILSAGRQLHAVRADRGLPRVADPAAPEPRPGRAADRRRRRRRTSRASTSRVPASRRRRGRATT